MRVSESEPECECMCTVYMGMCSVCKVFRESGGDSAAVHDSVYCNVVGLGVIKQFRVVPHRLSLG